MSTTLQSQLDKQMPGTFFPDIHLEAKDTMYGQSELDQKSMMPTKNKTVRKT